MEEIGLIPSNTEAEGGKKTGHSMSHYIVKGGKFQTIIAVFLKNNPAMLYEDRPEASIKRKAAKNKIKYTCPGCGINAWGKHGLNVMCSEDKETLVKSE